MNRHARTTSRQKGTTMNTNAEATTTIETAAVAEQGANAVPEQTTSTKRASRKKNAPKAKKGAKEAKPAKKSRGEAGHQQEGRQTARQTHPGEGQRQRPRQQQEDGDSGPDPPEGRRHPGRARQGHRLAEPQHPRLHLGNDR
jgi:hypothetical protein